MTKLTDLCDIQYGYAFDSGAFTDDESYPQLVRIRDVKRGYSETYYNGEYPEEYVLSAGDLLIGMDGEFNIARWKVDGALLNQRVCKIIAKDNADEEFLRFALSKALKAIEDRTSFATVKHLSAKELNKLEIQVPPYEEQKKISEILHRLEKVIDIRQNELASLDELIKARFVELFGDPEDGTCMYSTERLKDLSIKISDGVHAKPNYTETGRPFLSVVNINKGIVDFTDCKYVSEEAYQTMIRSTHPERGDVLYTKVGATYGIPAFIDTDKEFCLYVSVCLIKPDHDKINSRFLAIQMGMPSVKHQADSRIKGIGVPDLHLNQISEFSIVCPPREMQDSFVSFVEQVDKSKDVVQKSLEETQTLFDSLMQNYFG